MKMTRGKYDGGPLIESAVTATATHRGQRESIIPRRVRPQVAGGFYLSRGGLLAMLFIGVIGIQQPQPAGESVGVGGRKISCRSRREEALVNSRFFSQSLVTSSPTFYQAANGVEHIQPKAFVVSPA